MRGRTTKVSFYCIHCRDRVGRVHFSEQLRDRWWWIWWFFKVLSRQSNVQHRCQLQCEQWNHRRRPTTHRSWKATCQRHEVAVRDGWTHQLILRNEVWANVDVHLGHGTFELHFVDEVVPSLHTLLQEWMWHRRPCRLLSAELTQPLTGLRVTAVPIEHT